MPAYVVNYDLQQPGQNFPRLSKAIEDKYGTHWHMLESTWIVFSTESTKQIYEYLAPNIDQNDKLFVGACQARQPGTVVLLKIRSGCKATCPPGRQGVSSVFSLWACLGMPALPIRPHWRLRWASGAAFALPRSYALSVSGRRGQDLDLRLCTHNEP